ncbi:RxLR effector protein [Phytophthora megakarya]|uniref:RxLR effector protein n=1 Tax=Phytophthora megakarya TaxID=4795 RepID=A0A225WJM4_9STRA|nr:RxLR effector protein [Phytophthora megakarya]
MSSKQLQTGKLFMKFEVGKVEANLFESPQFQNWFQRSVAIKLEIAELEQWLSSGKSSEEAFKLLSLNDETGNLLKNPTFNTWISYITKAYKENPYDAFSRRCRLAMMMKTCLN